MEFTNFKSTYDLKRTNLLDDLSSWSEQLVDLLQSRVFGNQFEELIKQFMAVDYTAVSRITEEKREEQLEVCSQMRATFGVLADELKSYGEKKKREYKQWKAPLMQQARDKVVQKKIDMYKAGYLSKTSINATADEAEEQFLIDNREFNEAWHVFQDTSARAHSLLKNLVEDIDSRSKILMSLRKKTF